MNLRYSACIGLIVALFIFASFGAAPVHAAPTTAFQFSKNLQLRDTGPDVLLLQQFLNAQGFLLAQTGLGSPGNETSIFGLRTLRALTRFQAAHKLPPTGFLGPLTRSLVSHWQGLSVTTPDNATVAPPKQITVGTSTSSATASTTSNPSTPTPWFPSVGISPGYGGGGGDTTPPVITGTPSNIIAEATSASGAAVNYAAPIATDNVDGSDSVACSPASGSSFALGTTTVTCTATDKSGNSSHSTFSVTVRDTTAPSIGSTPSNVTTNATGSNGAVVTFTNPTATDLIDGAVSVSCSPASGSTFPLGTNVVTCTATDGHGNTATSTFQVIIQHPNAVLTLPSDITSEATSANGAVVTFSPTASDVVDGTLAVSCTPASGSTFALGTTTVNCSATNSALNTTSGSFRVVVRDTTSPTISLTVPSSGATVVGSSATLTATDSDNVGVTGVQFKVDGANVGSSGTGSPYSIVWNSLSLGNGSHTIAAVAHDAAGNYATSSISVTVANNVTYYVSPTGNDSNNGTSSSTPWQTVTKVNAGTYHPGDTVSFQGGQSFTGCLAFTASNVTSTSTSGTPFTVGAYGTGSFTLTANCSGTQAAAIKLQSVNNVVLQDGILAGNSGGAEYGVWISNPSASSSGNITVQRMDISGFYTTSTSDYGGEIFMTGFPGTGGLNKINILGNTLHGVSGVTSPDDNGVSGYGNGKNITNVLYQGNTIYNIGAKANGFAGTEGNGILAAGVDGATMQNNVAHDLGANTNTCGGPAALWAYNSNNVTIQFNEAYRVQPNSYTAGCDWVGFDLDGSVTNSTIQYNYSHDNFGSGYLLYGAGTWGPNTVRYNISENDDRSNHDTTEGSIRLSNVSASTFIANVYNNTVWQGNPGPVSVRPTALAITSGVPTGGVIANNIFAATPNEFGQVNFLTTNSLSPSALTFKNNAYYSINSSSRQFLYGNSTYTSLAAWQAVVTGGDTNATTSNPLLLTGGSGGTCGGYSTACPSAYKLQNVSLFGGAGLNLTNSPFSLSVGSQDYFGNAIPNLGAGTGYNIGAYGADPATAPDTTSPSVSVTAPSNSAVVSGPSVTLTATDSDNVGVTGVQFKVDGASVGSSGITSPYSITWDSTSVISGSHTIVAVAHDAAGNYATSSSISVTVDNTAPTVSVTAPANGATVGGSVVLSASASDNVAVAGVTFKANGTTIGSEDTSAPYSVTWNTTATSSGAKSIVAIARDTAGNLATSSAITVTVSQPIVIFLTSGTSWTVPSDWNSSNNKIETIAGGASGAASISSSQGGGGGAYNFAANVSLTPNVTVTVAIGAGGAAVSVSNGSTNGNDGGDTCFGGSTLASCTVGSQHGSAGKAGGGGGAGGLASAGVGSGFNGGNGGSVGSNSSTGGGGAAGPNGAGASSGSVGTGSNSGGGQGDNGFGGVGGNTSGSGGSPGTVEWTSNPGGVAAGSGGGGGSVFSGGGSGTAGSGGNYGAGGGGSKTGFSATSGAGKPGIIVITYTP